MPFSTDVFINCPFDKSFKPILDAIVFCIIRLGYNPRLSETTTSGDSRISGILELIENSKYSIHDLSRMGGIKKKELARFNMPFELGLDLGCKEFGNTLQQTKVSLILDKEKYRYQRSISDLSGNDIGSHGNNPENAVREVRNWIRRIEGVPMDSANKIWKLYGEFTGDFREEVDRLGFNEADLEQMPISEYSDFIKTWLETKIV